MHPPPPEDALGVPDDLTGRARIGRRTNDRFTVECPLFILVTKMHFAFQTPSKLYLVLDYCAGGAFRSLVSSSDDLTLTVTTPSKLDLVLPRLLRRRRVSFALRFSSLLLVALFITQHSRVASSRGDTNLRYEAACATLAERRDRAARRLGAVSGPHTRPEGGDTTPSTSLARGQKSASSQTMRNGPYRPLGKQATSSSTSTASGASASRPRASTSPRWSK